MSTATPHAEESRPDLLAAALAAHRAGLGIVPAAEDGSKRPDVPSWKQYQSERSTEDEIDYWFANGRTGIGIITGAVSGNLEALDFDSHGAFESFIERARECGLGDLVERVRNGYEEHTPNGVHLLTRCERIDGNLKLAQRADHKAVIETRGEGGFVVIAPSYGAVHPSGHPYVLVRGGFDSIVTITPEEREALHELARSFDELPRREYREPAPARPPRPNGELRAGDDFNARATWREVLDGWTVVYQKGVESYWRRPGKNLGISATTNYEGSDLFYVFSTSTAFEPERGYSKFSAYTLPSMEETFRPPRKHSPSAASARRAARAASGTSTRTRSAYAVSGRGSAISVTDRKARAASRCSCAWPTWRLRRWAGSGSRICRAGSSRSSRETLDSGRRGSHSRSPPPSRRSFLCLGATECLASRPIPGTSSTSPLRMDWQTRCARASTQQGLMRAASSSSMDCAARTGHAPR